jgi:hypothetical protein
VFICLSETWLCDSFYDSELGLSNYIIFRCDRNSLTSNFCRGGGVLIAIRTDIVCTALPSIVNNIEHLFVKFCISNTTFVICSVYFPPNSPISIYESFLSAVQSILLLHPNCTFIFCGDFNLSDITWSNDEYGLTYFSNSGPRVQCIPETFAFNNFFQINGVPNSFGTFLDLVFSNDIRISVEKADVVTVPCDPYHPALDILISLEEVVPILNTSHKYFDFRRGSYSKICSFLESFNWLETITILDIDSATSTLYDALYFSILNFVPEINYVPSKFPRWFSKDLKSIVFDKKRAHAKYKVSRSPQDYEVFSNLRARYKSESKKCYNSFLTHTETMLNLNPRSFWDFVRKNKCNNGIPNTVHFDGLQCSGNASVSNLFSSYFNTVYVSQPLNNHPIIPSSQYALPSNCSFSMEDVETGLEKLKNVKSVGPDGISGTFLYNIKSSLCFPLWLIFRRSMDAGVFPSMFKMSSVTPIFKSGDKSNVKNYRPISILSHIAKLFELLVLRYIQPPVNSILIDEQYGFRPGRCATMNLIVFNNFVLDAFENHNQVDVIYTDFAKAFDRVDHGVLLEILYKYGFGEPLLSWFKSYLSGRVQWVKVLGCKSVISNVPSGVPQGGHLSPLLFSLFINDIKKVVPNCQFLMFADDLKLFRKIVTIDDCLALQNELNIVVSWFSSIGLQLNIEKCQSMTFTKSRSNILHTYMINGFNIAKISCKKDLGVIFNVDLDYQPHINNICCRAFKTLGFVIRTSKEFKLSTSLKTIYCSIVRSLLEYASVLWDPYTSKDSSRLERVQRRFLSSAAYLLKIQHPQHDYLPVMRELCLDTLADRRVNANLTFLKKLVDGFTDAPTLLSQLNFKVPSCSTRLKVPFILPFRSTNYGRNHPLDRMMRLANENATFLIC